MHRNGISEHNFTDQVQCAPFLAVQRSKATVTCCQLNGFSSSYKDKNPLIVGSFPTLHGLLLNDCLSVTTKNKSQIFATETVVYHKLST